MFKSILLWEALLVSSCRTTPMGPLANGSQCPSLALRYPGDNKEPFGCEPHHANSWRPQRLEFSPGTLSEKRKQTNTHPLLVISSGHMETGQDFLHWNVPLSKLGKWQADKSVVRVPI